MPSVALNAHEKQARTFSEYVWFEGITALLEGQAVCYNFDYGTDTDADARRFARVEVPAVDNAQFFAGVTARKYPASSTGQMIEIYKPGSLCRVQCGVDTVVGVGRLTCEITDAVATNGSFRYSGLEGEGSCIPMQTTTFDTTNHKCLVLLDGPGRPSGLLEVVQLVDDTAFVAMVGGTTLLVGAVLGTGDAEETLDDGTRDGLRKKFGVITTEITTNDAKITVTTGQVLGITDTDLATVTFEEAATNVGSHVTLEWNGAWNVVGGTKTDPVLA